MWANSIRGGLVLFVSGICVASQAPALAQDTQDIRDDSGESPVIREDESSAGEGWASDEAEVPADPARFITSLTGGASIRLVQDDEFRQQRFAPAYLDLFAAFVPSQSGVFRHGVGLGFSMNLSGDGDLTIGVDSATQFVFTPAYAAYLRFSDDFVGIAHAGFSIGVTSQPGWTETQLGVDVGFGAAYLILSGLGVYAEVSSATYLGAASSVHPMIGIEGGLYIDYEVLP